MFNKNPMLSNKKASRTHDQEPEQYVELDPTKRFGRYDTVLVSAPPKKVYKAFDECQGVEVAWSQVELGHVFNDKPELVDWVVSQIETWKTLDHENLVACYSVWKDEERKAVNFVSELCTSGTLRDFRKKHKRISSTALKRWTKQILEGLNYFHTRQPCLIHSDLNCSNIYVDGCTSQLKIGDPSFAALIGNKQRVKDAEPFLGTHEFTAPELLNRQSSDDTQYNATVNIYSLGMCLLEMATLEIPYSECKSDAVDVYDRASKGIKPEALSKVSDEEIKAFVEKCIVDQTERPTASELLSDPFFDSLS